jgi:hypothetical protein
MLCHLVDVISHNGHLNSFLPLGDVGLHASSIGARRPASISVSLLDVQGVGGRIGVVGVAGVHESKGEAKKVESVVVVVVAVVAVVVVGVSGRKGEMGGDAR